MIFALLIAALAITIAVYVSVISTAVRPQWSLYAYLALWLTVPKALRLTYISGGAYDFPRGITVFTVLEAIVALGIVVTMMVHPKGPPTTRDVRTIKRLWLSVLISGTWALFVSLGALNPLYPSSVEAMSQFLGRTVELQERILPVLSMLYAAVFVFGCARFIRTWDDVKPFLWLLALSSIELTAEKFVGNLGGLGDLDRYAIQETGRFNSLVFTSYDTVGAVAMFSLAASLCLAVRGSRIAWFTFALATIPILDTYQRSTMLGALAAVLFIACSVARIRSVVLVVPTVVAAVGSLLLTGWDHTVLAAVGHFLGGEIRPDYYSSDQLGGRFALWSRTFDLFTFIFPAGTGPAVVNYAMNYPFPGSSGLQSPLTNSIYSQLANGSRTTNAHNAYIQTLGEHGALAIPLMGAFALVAVRRFIRRIPRARDVNLSAGRLVQATAFAMLIAMTVNGLTTLSILPYFFYALPFYLLAVSRQPDGQVTSSRSASVQRSCSWRS